MRQTQDRDPVRMATKLIESHGLRAGAVAAEHAAQAQSAGDTAELERWRQVQTAIVELRMTARIVADEQRV